MQLIITPIRDVFPLHQNTSVFLSCCLFLTSSSRIILFHQTLNDISATRSDVIVIWWLFSILSTYIAHFLAHRGLDARRNRKTLHRRRERENSRKIQRRKKMKKGGKSSKQCWSSLRLTNVSDTAYFRVLLFQQVYVVYSIYARGHIQLRLCATVRWTKSVACPEG